MRVVAGDTTSLLHKSYPEIMFSTNGSLMILGAHMLLGIVGLLGGRLPGL
jgi:hypothetical protein